MDDPYQLSTHDVARILGVKPETIYAYVSKGLLRSRRNADGKRSMFAKEDIDAFAAGRKRPSTPGIKTGITLIAENELYYRGRDACLLADDASFEEVATLLWTGHMTKLPFVPDPAVLETAIAASSSLPAGTRTTDRLQVIVAAAATADPMRFDISPKSVEATARALLATMVVALPGGFPGQTTQEDERNGRVPIAQMLRHRLNGYDDLGDSGLFDAALVLLADHDIAASTLAARVAASTRAHPYAVVSAGLAALVGPLHGAAGGAAHALIAEAIVHSDPVRPVAERLRSGGPVPGFGHPLYPQGDPRADTLMHLMSYSGRSEAEALKKLVDELVATVLKRSGLYPNIDFALAVLSHHLGMPADAGEAIFAVARTAGWIAHAIEEYDARPLRFRPNGQFTG